MVSGVGRPAVTSRCEVCGAPKLKGKPTLVWTPDAEERDRYKKVWVHPYCRERLLYGERPPGVEVRGVPDHALLEIVKLCESQLGCVAPELLRIPRIPASQRRKVREREVTMLRTRIEQAPETIDLEQLRMAINSLLRRRKDIKRARDLVTEVASLRRQGLFDPEPTPHPYADLPF